MPLSHPTLTVIPILPEIAEGDHLFLICGVRGSPPVTFKWYRVGEPQPLFTATSDRNNTDYQVQPLAKRHSGDYYCEAANYANNVVRSEPVTIEGESEHWDRNTEVSPARRRCRREQSHTLISLVSITVLFSLGSLKKN